MDNSCTTEHNGEHCVVTVSGEVDLSWSSQLRREILDALERCSTVIVRMDDVAYIDSSGIAALVEGYQTAKAGDKRFALAQLSEPVTAVLQLARLDQVFPIYGSVEDALAA